MTDELIERLVLDLEPVKALRRPWQRSIRFAFLAVFATTVTASLLGLRSDLCAKIVDPSYVAETGLLLVLFGAATLGALRSGVPGTNLAGAVRVVAVAASVWLLIVGARCGGGAGTWGLPSGLACVRRTLLLGAFPASALLTMLRRSAALEGAASGTLAMVAAGAVAVLGTRILCGKDDATHVLAWHIAPLALFALLGWFVGRAWFGVRNKSRHFLVTGSPPSTAG